MTRKLVSCLVIPLVFFTDRVLKISIIHHFTPGQEWPILQGVFHLTRVNNTGAAFGLLKGQVFFLNAVSLVCIFLLSAYLWKRFSASAGFSTRVLAASLVLAGALGNWTDRVTYGYVVDFLDFRVWPVFNLADVSICAGAFLMVFGFLKGWD